MCSYPPPSFDVPLTTFKLLYWYTPNWGPCQGTFLIFVSYFLPTGRIKILHDIVYFQIECSISSESSLVQDILQLLARYVIVVALSGSESQPGFSNIADFDTIDTEEVVVSF